MNDNEQRAIMGGGCITLLIAVAVAAVFLLAAIIDCI